MFAFAGCGPVKATPNDAPAQQDAADASGDAPPPPCDLEKPFAPAVEIPNLHNASFNDTHATLSADERTIFFASDREGQQPPIFHIYSATRASATQPFPAAQLVGSLFSTEGESHPTTSADGNTVLFDSFRIQAGTVHIFTSTRSNVTVDFPVPTVIPGDFIIDPAITADGDVLYGANLSTGRLSRFEKTGASFGAAQDVAIPASSSVVSPVTNDDLLMFLGKGDTTGAEIISTKRLSTADPFPEPTTVVELDTAAEVAEPSWLSPDGCRLYLTYGETGGKTILHVATRPL